MSVRVSEDLLTSLSPEEKAMTEVSGQNVSGIDVKEMLHF